jgi:putative transposase
MPRQPRLELPSTLYHVTARGNDRRAIFRDDRDRHFYLSRIAFYRERFGFELFAYCLMTNHVHLAIRTGAEPLSRVIAGLHSTYAEYFNRRHGRVGHVFQGRYKAFLVQEDRYLLALLRYIHLNPVQARIVQRPRDYRWSSDRSLRAGRGPEWLDSDRLLTLIGASRRAAIKRYVELVDGPLDSTRYEDLDAVEGIVVGDDAFALERLESQDGAEAPRRRLTLEQVLDFVSAETGVPLLALAAPGGARAAASARRLAAYLARRVCRIPVRRVARRLGRDDSAFARPLARLEERLRMDSDARRRMETLVVRLRRVECEPPSASRAQRPASMRTRRHQKSKSQD